MSVTAPAVSKPAGIRKNGKAWHHPSKAFRPTSGQTSYARRVAREAQEKEVKTLEKEMEAEKEEERQVGCYQYVCISKGLCADWSLAEDSRHQGPPSSQRGEGTL